MTNPNYNYNCDPLFRNCTSGCCTSLGYCSNILSTCYYKYYDFNTNSTYYFPNAYNINCNSNSKDCTSGCCTYSGYCANTSSECYYRYSDYFTNSNYYFPGTINSYYYNSNCLSTAHNCVSGCCNTYGYCANVATDCYYRYSDYYTNYNYYFPGTTLNSNYNSNCLSTARSCTSGCCTYSGYCANTSSTCYYKYSDFSSNYNYYYPGDYSYYNNYNQLACGYGSTCYNKALSDALGKSIGIAVGSYLGYLLLVIIGIIYCYCKRKPTVQAINKMGTQSGLSTGVNTGGNTGKNGTINFSPNKTFVGGSTTFIGTGYGSSVEIGRKGNLVMNQYNLNTESNEYLNPIDERMIPGIGNTGDIRITTFD